MTGNAGHVYRARVGPDGAGETVLAHHVRRWRHSDAEGWRERIEAGLVVVNGERATCGRVLAEGDRLEYHRRGWVEPPAPEGVRVVFEDEHLLVVDKPAGLQVMPAGPFLERTLLRLLRGDDPARARWSPVHRIGRGTSGLVLVGKSDLARRRLTAGFRRRRLGKIYLAWCSGTSLPSTAPQRAPIVSLAHHGGRVHAVGEGGRPSLTLVRVLRRDEGAGASLVAAWPVTGRPDQIRIHLWWAGAPLVGEPLYGPGRTLRPARPGDVGYHLHATSLRFRHPATGERMRVRSLPPWSLENAPRGPVAPTEIGV